MAEQPIEAAIGALFGTECKRFVVSNHTVRRMRWRGVGYHDLLEIIRHGETIHQWTDDGDPCRLMLGFPGGRPLHAVLLFRAVQGAGVVVTVYEPNPSEWTSDFKRKQRS